MRHPGAFVQRTHTAAGAAGHTLQRHRILGVLQSGRPVADGWRREWYCAGALRQATQSRLVLHLEIRWSCVVIESHSAVVPDWEYCFYEQVFDVGSRAVLRQLKGHQRPVHVARFSPDKLHVLSGGDDATV